MDNGYMGMINNIQYMKVGIYLLLTLIAIILIMRMFRIRGFGAGRGVRDTLKDIEKQRERDYFVASSNTALRNLSIIIQNSPFKINSAMEDYLKYNLTRANWKAPGGYKTLEPKEYNALRVVSIGFLVCICMLTGILIKNIVLGMVLSGVCIVLGNTVPKKVLRSIVKAKDEEIERNFADLYLMIHYVLYTGAKTPIGKALKTAAKTSESEEIKRFVDVAESYMSQYGEGEATSYITNEYREVESVCELMKLIKQIYDKHDIRNDLLAFRVRIIDKKENLLDKRVAKLIEKARKSYIILMIILVQAIISAVIIFLPDLGGATSLFR